MKKKIILNRGKLTREAKLYPLSDVVRDRYVNFKPVPKNISFEAVKGYWRIISPRNTKM